MPKEIKNLKSWETVVLDGGVPNITTERLKVFGGWVLRDLIERDANWYSSMVFIPDPEHKWESIDPVYEDNREQMPRRKYYGND